MSPRPRKPAGSASDKLATYRKKRDPSITPEPIPAPDSSPRRRDGGRKSDAPKRFVIQEHHARALHWDFRLEREGVLVSWAVPKGLPLDKKTNRLAVQTEDHPLEYATFAGEIPSGEYGGGEVILWDSGTYEEIKWSEREVMVVLHGRRIEGQYVLFATESRSGKGRGGARRSWMMHRMDEAPVGYHSPPVELAPMLAALGVLPKDDSAWAFEFKWDGIRAVVHVDGGRIRIVSRNGNDLSTSFPELRAIGERLAAHQAVLDGEIVAFDKDGRPRFQKLQPRIHATNPAKAKQLALDQPAVYVIFDLLYLDGELLLTRPYAERRHRLESLGLEREGASWAVSPRFEGPGADVLQASRDQGLEGIVAKRLDSPYLPGKRTSSWTKVKNIRTQEVVVGGWTPGQGSRRGRFGSLLLGIPSASGLVYVGQVGTGFSDAILDDLGSRLGSLRSMTKPFANDVPTRYAKVAVWTEPVLVGEVTFSEWTSDGRLRHPSWRGLRDDKGPGEVRRES
ncbi:MAG TPA: non-homologous end-joining DNA ligase [Acidimicrobiales bacterium]|nr:non-homologous end-joining DNA ligase [Acidimicrobiales bacterium]